MTHERTPAPQRACRPRNWTIMLLAAASAACSEPPLRPPFIADVPAPSRFIDVDDEWNQMTLDVEVFSSGPTGATANATRGYRFSVARQLGSNGVWQSVFNLGSMYPSNAVLPAGMPSPPTRIETADDKAYLRVYNASGLMPSVTVDTSTRSAPPGLRARPKYATPFPSVAGVGGPILAAGVAVPFGSSKDSSRAWADAYIIGRAAKARALKRLLALPGVSRTRRDTVDVLSLRMGQDSVRVTMNPTTGLVHERVAFHNGGSLVKRSTYARLGLESYVLKESRTERRGADGALIGPQLTTRYKNLKLSQLSLPTN